ncbi:hypothetical protein [Zavarzinia sp.]|uniref:hypothetical protein n=1 Tax=Zavarzinia sp. TaxID=2027920 RepID=UPI003563CD30
MQNTAVPTPELRRIADGIYLHTSFDHDARGALIASNGLVVVGLNAALLIDTAWTAADTERLLGTVDRLTTGAPLGFYGSEAETDRLGGLDALHARHLPSLAHETTVAAALSRGLPVPATGWAGEALSFDVGGRQLEVFHPGAARTRGNTVVYIEDSGLLFGGAMVLPAAEAARDSAAPRRHALRSVIARFGRPRIVVPGRGAIGDGGLLAVNARAA